MMRSIFPGVVVLHASISFPANTPRGVAATAQPTIRNGTGTGILIDKFVFSSSLDVSVQLRWRNEPLTNGFAALAGMTYPQNEINGAAVNVIPLARPMYLPPNEYIDFAARNDLAAVGGGGATFTIAAIGRQADPLSDRWLPYFTTYRGPSYAQNATISDESTPNDLGNPFDTALYVERMIGRAFWGSLDSASSAGYAFNARISDHRDNAWVATPTPLPIFCNEIDRSWILHTEIEPKGYLRAEFEGVAPSAVASYRAVLGLVGYRRIG